MLFMLGNGVGRTMEVDKGCNGLEIDVLIHHLILDKLATSISFDGNKQKLYKF